MVNLNLCIVYFNVFECSYSIFVVYFNVSIIYFNAFIVCSMYLVCLNVFIYIVIGISPSHSHYNFFAMYTYLHIFFTLYNGSLPNMLYHYIHFYPFPLICSNFHTIYPYFSHLCIIPHSTSHVVTGCAEHSRAQVFFSYNLVAYIGQRC
jgi:hypothetical protein